MADVSDRGQLLLVTALAMAVAFVAVALTLNTAIYTENLATRSSDIAGGSEAIQFRTVAEDALGELLSTVNSNHNDSHDTLARNLSEGVDDWEDTAGKGYAMTADVVEIRNVDLTNGSKLVQNVTRNFTAADGSSNWTLASDVSETSTFWLNVTRSSLNETSGGLVLSEPVFTVQFHDDDGRNWWFFVYRNSSASTVNVTVDPPTGSATMCSVSREHAVINVTAGTLAGTDCPALQVLGDLNAPYFISYNNTDVGDLPFVLDGSHPTGNGTYRLVVDNGSVASNPAPYFNEGPGADSPQAIPTLFAASFDAIYESPRTRYNASVRATPGDAG